MERTVRNALVIGLALVLGGCATCGRRCAADPTASAEIGHEAHSAYVDAINSNDVDAVLARMTDDVVFLPPNGPRLVGKGTIRPWIEGYVAAFSTHWDKTSLEFEVAGDWAYELYSYASTDTPRDGGPVVRDTGKGIIIYRREADGAWRVSRDAWNSDLPAR